MGKSFSQKDVLSSNQRQFLNKLSFLKEVGFYLAGGTGLALQIKHRRSKDFDFYTQNHFKKGEIIKKFNSFISDWEMKLVRDVDDTFEISALPDIHLSCFFTSMIFWKKLKRLIL